MEPITLQLEIRNAIELSDELARHERALGNQEVARHLATTRTSLAELERKVGRSHEKWFSPEPSLIEGLARALHRFRGLAHELPPHLRSRLRKLTSSLERIVFVELQPSMPVPAKPVLRRLPLRRVVPQRAHSMMDYVAAAALLVTAKLARTRRARMVGLVLGTKLALNALLSDSRLSLARRVEHRVAKRSEASTKGGMGGKEDELHELLDHAAGASALAAPHLLGYRRKDPLAAMVHILAGLATTLGALVTDHRADRGLSRPIRSRGGPLKRGARGRGRRVRPDQRPLEGFANPSVLPRLDV